MNKKIVMIILCVSVSLGVMGCSKETKAKDSTKATTEQSQDTPASPADIPDDDIVQSETGPAEQPKQELAKGDYKDKGDGTMYIACDDSTSEDGNVPVIASKEGASVIMIEVFTKGFDGSKSSYIYVDGILSGNEQFTDSQYSLDLDGDAIGTGKHTVEVVQYSDDQPTGEVVTYKSASYEIKTE